jgi:hypothetical protein
VTLSKIMFMSIYVPPYAWKHLLDEYTYAII